jgi:hypothetical protein
VLNTSQSYNLNLLSETHFLNSLYMVRSTKHTNAWLLSVR